jgi:hypothetical protein
MRTIPESVYQEKYIENLHYRNLDDEDVILTEGNFIGLQDHRDGQKTHHINQSRKIANTILSYTDWYVSRKTERDIDIPVDILSHRQSVLDIFEQHTQIISDVTTEDELRNLYEYRPIDGDENRLGRVLPEWPRI